MTVVPPAFAPGVYARADALAFRGTFEAHLTVAADGSERVAAFEALCRSEGVKCVLIELSRGRTRQQPMTASYHRGSFADVVAAIEQLHARVWVAGYPVLRVKVEAVVPSAGFTAEDVTMFPDAYFEFHAKLRLPAGANTDDLAALCEAHGAHLSRNDRKRDARGAAERFVTLRVDPRTLAPASSRFDALLAALAAARHEIIAQKRELAVYDGRRELDAGWLPA